MFFDPLESSLYQSLLCHRRFRPLLLPRCYRVAFRFAGTTLGQSWEEQSWRRRALRRASVSSLDSFIAPYSNVLLPVSFVRYETSMAYFRRGGPATTFKSDDSSNANSFHPLKRRDYDRVTGISSRRRNRVATTPQRRRTDHRVEWLY